MRHLTFYQRAAKLGHSLKALKAGNEITSTLSIKDIDELKKLLTDHDEPGKREERANSLFNTSKFPVSSEAGGISGILDRINSYVYGNAEFTVADRELVRNAFPMKVTAVSATSKTIEGVWELGTSTHYMIINIDTLTMNNNSCIVIRNTPMLFHVGNLIRNGKPPAPYDDINILGMPGIPGSPTRQGLPGRNGSKGSPGTCASKGIARDNGGHGMVGETGSAGEAGGNGGDGLPSMLAEIHIIKSISGSSPVVTIESRSGEGGTGGAGGAGGKGGDGGDGGEGATCECTGSAGGNGGGGGTGGDGGHGGNGGNGADASGNILVYLPKGLSGKIKCHLMETSLARGGSGGSAGTGGKPGNGGAGGKHCSGGNIGAEGKPGRPGTAGSNSQTGGKPAEIIVVEV